MIFEEKYSHDINFIFKIRHETQYCWLITPYQPSSYYPKTQIDYYQAWLLSLLKEIHTQVPLSSQKPDNEKFEKE